jgi:two-component system CheB/CheR fusion protein
MLVNFADAFAPADLKLRIFTKIRPENGQDRAQGTYAFVDDARPDGAGASHRLRDISFEQDPTAQIVLDERRQLLATNARARELFNVTLRDVGRPLQDLELSYRPVDIRSCIDDADARRQVVHLREVAWPASGGQPRYFNVQVTPIFDAADTLLGTKIIFLDVSRQHELQEDLQRSRQELETAYEELQSTNEELETTNEELQSTVEELETTNEELQSTNEELETTNEELQSANEELETMNEELQSTNEELGTINDELRDRAVQLDDLNAFLERILGSIRSAVIVVDRDLRVDVWNHQATDLWGLRSNEVQGAHLLGLDIGLPVEQLKGPIRACLAGDGDRHELRLSARNRRGQPIACSVTCAPLVSAGGTVTGVVLLMDAEPLDEGVAGRRPA